MSTTYVPITAKTVTVEQLRYLRNAANNAGDSVQFELCDMAIDYVFMGRPAHEGHLVGVTSHAMRGARALNVCLDVLNLAAANAADAARLLRTTKENYPCSITSFWKRSARCRNPR